MTTAADFNRRIDDLVADLGPVFSARALEDFAEKARRASDAVEDHRTIQKRAALWPTISRSDRDIPTDDGRALGSDLDSEEQRIADAGYWATSKELREQCLPLIVAAHGVVEYAYEVRGWHKEGNKWIADLGRHLTARELREMRSPYLPGDEMPVIAPKAMWPCTVDITGDVYRAGKWVKVWEPARGGYVEAD